MEHWQNSQRICEWRSTWCGLMHDRDIARIVERKPTWTCAIRYSVQDRLIMYSLVDRNPRFPSERLAPLLVRDALRRFKRNILYRSSINRPLARRAPRDIVSIRIYTYTYICISHFIRVASLMDCSFTSYVHIRNTRGYYVSPNVHHKGGTRVQRRKIRNRLRKDPHILRANAPTEVYRNLPRGVKFVANTRNPKDR